MPAIMMQNIKASPEEDPIMKNSIQKPALTCCPHEWAVLDSNPLTSVRFSEDAAPADVLTVTS